MSETIERMLVRLTVNGEIAWLQKQHQWRGLAAIGKVVRSREINGVTTCETAYYGSGANGLEARLGDAHARRCVVLLRRQHRIPEGGRTSIFEVQPAEIELSLVDPGAAARYRRS